MNSNSSIKCPQCGFTGWINEQNCRRCGCDWTYVYPTSITNEEELSSSSSKKWLIWLAIIAVFVVVVAIAFKPQPKEKVQLSSSSKEIKKPLTTPGERVDYKEYMVGGKTNVIYFYADW